MHHFNSFVVSFCFMKLIHLIAHILIALITSSVMDKLGLDLALALTLAQKIPFSINLKTAKEIFIHSSIRICRQLTNTHVVYEKDMNALLQDLVSLQKHFNSIQDMASVYSTAKDNLINTLKQELASRTKDLKATREKLMARAKEVARMQPEVNALKTNLTQNGKHIAKLNEEINSLKARLTEKDQKISSLNTEVDGLKNDLCGAQEQLTVQHNNSVQKDHIVKNLTMELHTIGVDRDKFKAKFKAAEHTQQHIQQAMKETQKQLIASRSENAGLNFELQEAKQKLKAWQCDNTPTCLNCHFHLKKALGMARAAEAVAQDQMDRMDFDRLKAWSELHDYVARSEGGIGKLELGGGDGEWGVVKYTQGSGSSETCSDCGESVDIRTE